MKHKIYKIIILLYEMISEYVFCVCSLLAFAFLAIKAPFAINVLIFVIVSNVILGCIKIYRKRKGEKNGEHM